MQFFFVANGGTIANKAVVNIHILHGVEGISIRFCAKITIVKGSVGATKVYDGTIVKNVFGFGIHAVTEATDILENTVDKMREMC